MASVTLARSTKGGSGLTGEPAFVLGARLLLLAILLLLWQLLAGGPKSFLPAADLGRPTTVAIAIWQQITNGQLAAALLETALAVLAAMVVAAPIGIAIGVITSLPVGRWLFDPVVTITYAIPKVGLISIYTIILGADVQTHVALVVSAILFVYYFGARHAFETIDRDKLNALRLMGAGRLKIVRSFIVQAAIPELFAATRIALPLAFATVIFAELRVPAGGGLGGLLENLTEALNTAGAVGVMLVVVVIGYLIDLGLSQLLHRYTAAVGRGLPT